MPEQKSTNTAINPNIRAIPWYRRVLHSRTILFLINGSILIIGTITTIALFLFSSNLFWWLTPIMMVSSIFTVIQLLEGTPLRRSSQRPNKPADPPPAYTPSHTLPSTSSITTAVWSPDGQTLACASIDGTIHLRNAETGTLLHTLSGKQPLIWNLIWSPDGQQLAVSSLNGDIYLWHSETGKLLHTLSGHQDLAWSVMWSPDGRKLASGSLDHTVCLWDTETGKLLHRLSLHTEPVITVAWSPDGQKLTSGSLDQAVCLWDVQNGNLLYTLFEQKGPIRSLFWSLDGVALTCLSRDASLVQWQIKEIVPQVSSQFLGERDGSVSELTRLVYSRYVRKFRPEYN